MTGIVRHIGKADNFRRLLKSIDNFSFPHSGFGAVRTSVDIVLTKLTLFWQCWRYSYKLWTLFVQSCLCPCKVHVVRTRLTLLVQSVNTIRTKLSWSLQSSSCSYKKVVVLCTKLTLFAQSFLQRKKKVGKLILIWKPLHRILPIRFHSILGS